MDALELNTVDEFLAFWPVVREGEFTISQRGTLHIRTRREDREFVLDRAVWNDPRLPDYVRRKVPQTK